MSPGLAVPQQPARLLIVAEFLQIGVAGQLGHGLVQIRIQIFERRDEPQIMHPARALVHVHIVARRGHKGPPPGHTHGQTALRGLGVAPAYGPDGHAERFGQFPVRRQRFAGRKTAILNALRDGVGNEHVLGLSGMFPRLILIQSEQFLRLAYKTSGASSTGLLRRALSASSSATVTRKPPLPRPSSTPGLAIP